MDKEESFMKKAILVKDLFVSYHGNEALKNISFTVNEGNLVVL